MSGSKTTPRESEEVSSGADPGPWAGVSPPAALASSAEGSRGERSEALGPGEEEANAGQRFAPKPSSREIEVPEKASRRRFSAEYKLRILREADRVGPGGVGAILRREGLYSSHLAQWRAARQAGEVAELSRKRGRKPKIADPMAKRVAELERKLERTQEQLRQAQLIIEVQGKVARLLGLNPAEEKSS